jgi:hypothetical protein
MSFSSIVGLRVLALLLTVTLISAAQAATPAAPTGLIVSTASSTSLNLSWLDKSTDEAGLKIERSRIRSAGAMNATVNSLSYRKVMSLSRQD